MNITSTLIVVLTSIAHMYGIQFIGQNIPYVKSHQYLEETAPYSLNQDYVTANHTHVSLESGIFALEYYLKGVSQVDQTCEIVDDQWLQKGSTERCTEA